MASNYPTSLDSFPTGHNAGETILNTDINNLADATNKIEAELGINPSGSYTDIATALAAALTANSTIPVFKITTYGAVSGGSASTNATAIQAAINAASAVNGGLVWVPDGTYAFNTTIFLKSGVTIGGSGSGVGGPILNYSGADATHAFQNDAVNNSNLGIYGLRIDDVRSSPTSGDMIHIAETNGTIIEKCFVRCIGGAGIYIGSPSGTPDNYVVRHVWTTGVTYGLIAENVAENCILEDIKGDASTAHPFDSLIFLTSGATGYSNVVIIGAKCEMTSSPANLIHVDSTFKGTVTASGLHLGSNGAYILRNESTNASINLLGGGTPGPLTGMIYHLGTVYGNGSTTQRNISSWSCSASNHLPRQHIGNIGRGITTRTNLDLTLDATHDVVLFSTGASSHSAFLPAASLSNGVTYTIKKIDSGAGTVIIDPNASETVDGAATLVLTGQFSKATIVCDGASWSVI